MYDKGLFHQWVPESLHFWIIGILLVPMLTINAVYTSNIGNMVGSLGTMSETLMFAYYSAAIGMGVVFPVVIRAKGYFRSKELLMGSLTILAILVFISGTTEIPEVIVICSFLMGFFKMFGMFELLVPIMMKINPGGDRGRFYSLFYPIAIGGGQLASYGASVLAYNNNWQQVHIFAAAYILICLLLCIVFLHNKRAARQQSMMGLDWTGILLFSISFMLLNYVLVFAKQQAWFASENIIGATVAFIVFLGLFLYRESKAAAPMMSLSIFKKKNVIHGLLMIFLLGMFLSAGSVQTAVNTSVLGYDAPTNNLLNLPMIPGIVVAGMLGLIWFKRKWWLKIYVLIGFAAFELYLIIMYFQIAPVIDIESLILPSFLKGLGMGTLFISLGFYSLDKLSMPHMMSTVSILILIRSFLGMAFFGAITSWAMYQLQWQQAGNLVVNLDAMRMISQARGNGMALYGPIQVQALLAAGKTLVGYYILAGFAVLLYVGLHRFIPLHRRKMLLASKFLSGEKLVALKTKRRKRNQKEAAAAAAAGAI